MCLALIGDNNARRRRSRALASVAKHAACRALSAPRVGNSSSGERRAAASRAAASRLSAFVGGRRVALLIVYARAPPHDVRICESRQRRRENDASRHCSGRRHAAPANPRRAPIHVRVTRRVNTLHIDYSQPPPPSPLTNLAVPRLHSARRISQLSVATRDETNVYKQQQQQPQPRWRSSRLEGIDAADFHLVSLLVARLRRSVREKLRVAGGAARIDESGDRHSCGRRRREARLAASARHSARLERHDNERRVAVVARRATRRPLVSVDGGHRAPQPSTVCRAPATLINFLCGMIGPG